MVAIKNICRVKKGAQVKVKKISDAFNQGQRRELISLEMVKLRLVFNQKKNTQVMKLTDTVNRSCDKCPQENVFRFNPSR